METDNTYALIGARIREERSRRGMTLNDLASAIGVDAPRLSRFERGERGIDTVVLRSIALQFRVTLDSFFEESTPGMVTLARQGDADDEAMKDMVAWGTGLMRNMEFVEREAGALQ